MSSLIEMILSQKIILLSLGAAVLIFLAAITLALVGYLKRQRASRPKPKMVAATEEATFQPAASVVRPPAQAGSQPAAVKAGTAAAASPAAPAVAAAGGGNLATRLAAKPAAAAPSAPAPLAAESTTETKTDPAMSDLLSSVFSDEEASARYAILLEGLKDVEIAHLTALCDQVSHQIHSGQLDKTAVTVAKER